ncbi:hypothetical protein [Streptomyces sp. 846.5]|uniref:hypothetical protein n=1 Tax=Streptacidiphilus sp. EB103A TaxID=3156275 RepID=UPI001063A08F|nr:hypothetical protein [Streptomyces sp. 846.5]TDU04538.1 hypothetical protein EDD99_3007 [Streptomyces sp. 846.5]
MTSDTSGFENTDRRYVRLQIELIVEIADEKALQVAALEQVRADEFLEDEERAEAVAAIEIDPAGAIAHFVDPVAMLEGVPGVELAEATWESQPVDYDPENEDWDLYDAE